MNPVYSMCTLNCYGGPLQLMHVAKKVIGSLFQQIFLLFKGLFHSYLLTIQDPKSKMENVECLSDTTAEKPR